MKTKQTSQIRRVDNLGRIVLPKQVRQKFHLATGSQVLVDCDDEKIVVTNYQKIDDLNFLLEKCVKVLEKKCNVLICSRTEILAASFNPQNKEDLFNFVENAKHQILYDSKSLKLCDNQKTLAVFPIFAQGDFFGAVVLVCHKFLQNFDFVLPIVNLIEEFLKD